jgi:hypothetical protein
VYYSHVFGRGSTIDYGKAFRPCTGDGAVTEDEVEVVAEELAKAGGTSWYPGRERGPLLRVVVDRYRDRARLAIAALDRYRATKAGEASPAKVESTENVASTEETPDAPSDTAVRVGSTVVYRPPGEQRAYPCRVERIEGEHAYLVPQLRAWTGWVSINSLGPAVAQEKAGKHS